MKSCIIEGGVTLSFNITMPKWGLTMKEGKISKWFKKEGDPVEKGEELFEVETEKIINTVEASASGILFQIVAPVGATVPVTAIVAIIAEPGERPERIEDFQVGEEVPRDDASTAGGPVPVQPRKAQDKKSVVATPAARRMAKELDIDLIQVPGTGPGGRIKQEDVAKYHEAGPPSPRITPLAQEVANQIGADISTISGTGEGGKITKGDVERALEARRREEGKSMRSIPYTGIRKTIAENMYASLHNTAQLTVFTEVDVSELMRFRDLVREEYKDDESVRVSCNDIIILATSRALKRFPVMNSTLAGDEISLKDAVNMGIAVALPDGLIVPVLQDADKKDLLQIARESRELIRRAREGTLTHDEVTGGTFTITSLGPMGIDGFTPILRPPETGILGIGRIIEKPAVYQGEIAIRSMMYLSLTFDHRVVDGAPASEFLQVVVRYVQHPALIMT